jgi:hypothetical protein
MVTARWLGPIGRLDPASQAVGEGVGGRLVTELAAALVVQAEHQVWIAAEHVGLLELGWRRLLTFTFRSKAPSPHAATASS